MSYLKPLESENRVLTYDRGLHRVQLELPIGSTITDSEAQKIIDLSAWNDKNIKNKIGRFEGGRSVIINREVPNQVHATLQISGIVNLKVVNTIGHDRVILSEEQVDPPSTSNFKDTPLGKIMCTSSVKNGQFIAEDSIYKPTGAYLENDMIKKIRKTRIARSLELPFHVPHVEAYGRYPDMQNNGESLSFCVFSSPSSTEQRFGRFCGTIQSEPNKYQEFIFFATKKLSNAIRVLHEKNYVHRQLHADNFYILVENDELFLVDWETMIHLVEVPSDERNLYKAIDLTYVCEEMHSMISQKFPFINTDAIFVNLVKTVIDTYTGLDVPISNYEFNCPKTTISQIIEDYVKK